MTFRRLQPNDYDKGLYELLGQLTSAPKVSKADFVKQLGCMKNSVSYYINMVCEDEGKIVAFGTCLVTPTLQGKIGRIESIVTKKEYRGRGYGKKLIELLTSEARKFGAQRLSLYCEEKNVEFYSKLGYMVKGTMMRKDA